ncbi:riboflavin-binding protein-like [Dendronephthya gigantea]|uniref:riboflavin-binding protein-like n=1 Tax=Dendronephthya gigantea TaxID=151771 RepID=UPI00106BCB38|nr:riboflavin-binding protein-like [Dendronephthya gigantea]XP_028408755.1 riboflavin-binding protein-like [Dendronephthya gigantea]
MLYEKQYLPFVALLSLTLSTWCIVPSFCNTEQCLEGPYHRKTPLEESQEYKFCTPWKNLTCCTVRLDNEIDQGNAPKLYNDTWHLCGNLSTECLKHWKRQECFYQCSPYAYQWKDSKVKDALNGVPICASECDAWFDACKSDLICVKNVIEDYERTMEYKNKCPGPSNNSCVNYTVMYGSGESLCNHMWGNSYKYVKEDGNNCMKFWFNSSENPNSKVLKEVRAGSLPVSVFSSKLLFAMLFSVMVFTN